MSVLDILSRSTYTKFADWCNNKEQMGIHENKKGCYCVTNSLCVYSCAEYMSSTKYTSYFTICENESCLMPRSDVQNSPV